MRGAGGNAGNILRAFARKPRKAGLRQRSETPSPEQETPAGTAPSPALLGGSKARGSAVGNHGDFPSQPASPGVLLFLGSEGRVGGQRGAPNQRSTAQGGQQKILLPGQAGSAGAPVAAASGSGLYPHLRQSSPSRLLLPSRSHS